MCGGVPDPRAAPAARLHRQLPVAQRAHRLPHRRRHPGGHGPARRHVRHHRQSGSTLEKFWQTLQAIPTETSVPTLVVSLAVLGTILGLERVNRKIPGALIAVVGVDRRELRPRPHGERRHRPRRRCPAACPSLGLPDGRDHDRQYRRAAADGDLDGRRDPRAERRHVARLRDEVRRQLRRERRPHRPRRSPTSAPASAARSSSTAAPPRPRWSTARAAGARSRS